MSLFFTQYLISIRTLAVFIRLPCCTVLPPPLAQAQCTAIFLTDEETEPQIDQFVHFHTEVTEASPEIKSLLTEVKRQLRRETWTSPPHPPHPGSVGHRSLRQSSAGPLGEMEWNLDQFPIFMVEILTDYHVHKSETCMKVTQANWVRTQPSPLHTTHFLISLDHRGFPCLVFIKK